MTPIESSPVVTILKSELESWHQQVTEALEPAVPFNIDKSNMLESAYQLRTEKLKFLNERLLWALQDV